MPIVCKVINNPDTLDKNLTKVVSKTIYTLDEQDIIFEQSVKEDYKQTLKRQLEFKKSAFSLGKELITVVFQLVVLLLFLICKKDTLKLACGIIIISYMNYIQTIL